MSKVVVAEVVAPAAAAAATTTGGSSGLVEDRRATRRKRQPLVTNNWWEPQTASKNFVHVHSKEQFDAVLATANGNPHTPIPVVVDFFATWCNACRGFFPKWMKTVAEEQSTLFVCVEYDENKDWVTAMGVETLPMVMFFNGDKEPLFTTPVSMAPMRVQMFQQQLALHSAPRCILPEAGEKLPLASEIVRLHRVTFTWRGDSEAKEVMLAGEPFGSWSTFVSMKKDVERGVWEFQKTLTAGTYRFKFIVDGVWESSASYPQDVDVKDNVNNVITIREADWPMLWRMSNASLNYLHGSALTCPLPKSALPPAPNPTGENSFDRSVTVNNAAADATSRQLPPFKVSLAKPDLPVMQGAVDSEAVKKMVAAELAPLKTELAEIKQLLHALADKQAE